MIWLNILAGLVTVVSLATACIARRGRRIDDHPLCRKCGFDLFGKPADSTACAECGRDITRKRTIRIGNRQPRRRLLAAAVAIGIIAAGWLGVMGYAGARGVDWNHYKPIAWLLHDAEGTDVSAQNTALAELKRRIESDELAGEKLTEVVDMALEIQGDQVRSWSPGWGRLIEAARNVKQLDDGRWERYARQGLGLQLAIRSAIRVGDPLVYRIDFPRPTRLGDADFYYDQPFDVDHPNGDATVYVDSSPVNEQHLSDEAKEKISPQGFFGEDPFPIHPRISQDTRLETSKLTALKTGGHILACRVPINVCKPIPPSGGGLFYTPQVIMHVEVEVVSAFEVLPADAPPVIRVVHDPALRPDLSIRIIRMKMKDVLSDDFRTSGDEKLQWLRLDTIRRSAASAKTYGHFDVFFESQGKEQKVTELSLVPGPTYPWNGLKWCPGECFSLPPEPRLDIVNVILRPSVEIAIRKFEMTEMWGEEIRFKDVKIER